MDELDHLRAVCAEAYQAIGAMADDLGIVGRPEIIRLMDNLDAASTGDPSPMRARPEASRFPILFRLY